MSVMNMSNFKMVLDHNFASTAITYLACKAKFVPAARSAFNDLYVIINS